MPVLSEHRFNVRDYYRLVEIGVLRPDARTELLNGLIIDKIPISPFHGGVNKRLLRHFTLLSNGHWQESAQNPLRLDDYSEPKPDFMLLKPSPTDYADRHPQPEDVFLLIEVSDSTLDYDREEKLPAYGRAGVPDVWIVNLINAGLEIYRDPHFTGYDSKTELHPGAEAAPLAFQDAVMNVVELLKR